MPAEPLAHFLAYESQKDAAPTPSPYPPAEALDPDLARVLAAWPKLSDAARRMILGAVDAAASDSR
jgi:hypothetical protein